VTDSLVKYQAKAGDFLAAVQGLERIESDEMAVALGEVLVDVKSHLNLLKEEEARITKPQREALDATRALFRNVSDRFLQTETAIKRLVADYTKERREKEQAALAAAMQAPTDADQRSLVNVAALAGPVLQGINVREASSFEVVDAAQLPREFLTPDLKKIGAFVRSTKGTTPIPGVKIATKSVVSARGR
jgi:virulence-associated protein VagC